MAGWPTHNHGACLRPSSFRLFQLLPRTKLRMEDAFRIWVVSLGHAGLPDSSQVNRKSFPAQAIFSGFWQASAPQTSGLLLLH